MKGKKIVALLTTGILTASLLAAPAQAAEAPAPQPYTISASQWSREDYSQEANPSVFTGVYSSRHQIPSGTLSRPPPFSAR